MASGIDAVPRERTVAEIRSLLAKAKNEAACRCQSHEWLAWQDPLSLHRAFRVCFTAPSLGDIVARDPERPSADPVQQLFELSLDLMGTASTDGCFTRLNPAWERTLGWTREELMAAPYLSFVHPDDVEPTTEQAADLASPGSPEVVAFENRYRTRDGDYVWLQWTTVARKGVLYFVAKEVTDRKAAEADHDRAASLTQAMADSVVDGLFVVDSQGRLTFVNPAALRLLGYHSEQELIGRRHHATFHHTRSNGTPYPVEDCPLPQVRITAQPLHVEEDTFWRADGTPLPVSYSSAPIELIDGTGSVVAFRDVSAVQSEREELRAQAGHVVWFERVREALNEGRFVLYGQPIVSLATGAVVGHELLLRMLSPTGEVIAPGLFLPAAEKYGLINDIDRWVISEAAELAAAGRAVAVNLSAESVGRVEILLHIERELSRHGAPAENLTFEVTETALMTDLDAGRRFADHLVALGCSFALDDFGTGYGSLTYLRQLPISQVKIDVQFVREMAHSEPDQKLVQAIVHIANSLGKTTVAEGVEDEQTLDLLRDYGVDCAQGYHLGRPERLAASASDASEAPSHAGHQRDDLEELASRPGQAAADHEGAAPGSTSSEATEPTRDETAQLRDVAASSRDLVAEVRDQAAGRHEKALLANEESSLQALLAASKEARSRAAADRASSLSDRQRAAVERGHPTADSRKTAKPMRDDTARQRDAAANSRDVAANARDRAAGRQEDALLATEESSGSTSRALVEASEDVRNHAAVDRADSAIDRQGAAADRDQAATDREQAATDKPAGKQGS